MRFSYFIGIFRMRKWCFEYHFTIFILLHCKIQGDHKKRAKYRFASKTLMRLLPANIKKEVEDLIESKSISLDLYDVLGQCTWGQNRLDKEASAEEKSKVGIRVKFS